MVKQLSKLGADYDVVFLTTPKYSRRVAAVVSTVGKDNFSSYTVVDPFNIDFASNGR